MKRQLKKNYNKPYKDKTTAPMQITKQITQLKSKARKLSHQPQATIQRHR